MIIGSVGLECTQKTPPAVLAAKERIRQLILTRWTTVHTVITGLGYVEGLVSRALDLLAVLGVAGRDEVLMHLLPSVLGRLQEEVLFIRAVSVNSGQAPIAVTQLTPPTRA